MSESESRIEKLRDLLTKATPLPWRSMRDGNQFIDGKAVGASRIDELKRPWNPHKMVSFGITPSEFQVARFTDADADLIVAAVNALPELLTLAAEKADIKRDHATPSPVEGNDALSEDELRRVRSAEAILDKLSLRCPKCKSTRLSSNNKREHICLECGHECNDSTALHPVAASSPSDALREKVETLRRSELNWAKDGRNVTGWNNAIDAVLRLIDELRGKD